MMSGTKLGAYEILALIGQGGMGEVYRATDTKLKRDVAFKVLPQALANEPDRLARFQREAEVLASLNHPNIAQIYGLEEAEGIRAIVMELVEGDTLAEIVERGPIPVETAIVYAKQIASAFEYAHDKPKPVIHRDLKPANVKVTPEGVVKVLDFGLAKALADEPQASGSNPANSPTLTMGPTVVGMILGTAAYMSPEQAKGKTLDRRTDIWSFGVVLYEMVSGKRLFTGEEAADILAAIVLQEPNLEAAPARLRPAIQRCLRKDPRKRWYSMEDVRFALDEAPAESGAAPMQAEAHATGKLAWIAAGVISVSFAALALVHFREAAPSAPQMFQFTVDAPPKSRVTDFALSPDGRFIAMVATGERGLQIWVRPLESLEGQALAGTEGASYPFWSPDSRYIGFFSAGKLKKIAVTGGPAQTLCDSGQGRGGAWSPEGVIVFAAGSGGLLRVSAAGGVPSGVTESGGALNLYPTFLPDGRRFLYLAVGGDRGVYLGSLDAKPGSDQPRRISADASNTQYAPPSVAGAPGYLLFLREQTLMAQPVKPDTIEPAGEVFPVAEQVSSTPGANYYLYSTSRNGIVAYLPGSADLRAHALFDRSGKQVAAIGAPVRTEGRVALSPDEKRMISERRSGNKSDLWITDLERGTESRFTFDASGNIAPVWSPDGSHVVFASARGGGAALYQKPSNQAGQDELLVRSEFPQIPSDWTHDGRFVIVRQSSKGTGFDLLAIPVSGDKKAIPLLQSPFNEIEGTVSPDGHWLAYASDESGRYEVYVQPFAPGAPKLTDRSTGGKWQISLGGGRDPHWRRDGRELFYISPNRKMTAVEVKASGDSFAPGTPKALFEARLFADGTLSRYAVSADGKRFLVAADPEVAGEAPIHVTVNWLAGVKK